MTIEDMFVTREGDLTFHMIEDEQGDVFWGYGHREGPEFIEEVNRWLIHTMSITDPDDLFYPQINKVDHLWARQDVEVEEHFDIVEPVMTEADAFNFPVTRLVF